MLMNFSFSVKVIKIISGTKKKKKKKENGERWTVRHQTTTTSRVLTKTQMHVNHAARTPCQAAHKGKHKRAACRRRRHMQFSFMLTCTNISLSCSHQTHVKMSSLKQYSWASNYQHKERPIPEHANHYHTKTALHGLFSLPSLGAC